MGFREWMCTLSRFRHIKNAVQWRTIVLLRQRSALNTKLSRYLCTERHLLGSARIRPDYGPNNDRPAQKSKVVRRCCTAQDCPTPKEAADVS